MPSTTVRQYYLQGTGGTNTCTSLGQNISGDLSFEYIVQGNGSGGYIIGFGMSPDSGWGGSESSDLRCFSAGGGVYYDWGSFRREKDSSPNMNAFYGHKMKIEGSKLGIKCTDLETNTVLFNWSVSASGTPSGPLMLCTTSGVRFYEGKVWKNSTLLLDYTVDENGLKENVNNTRPSVSNLTLTYEEVTTEYWPDDTPQQDNVLAGKTPTILLFRRRILSTPPILPVEPLAYIYLDGDTYYELDSLDTEYYAWNVECVFKYMGTGGNPGQKSWNGCIDNVVRKRLGCTFFTQLNGATDINCGWGNGKAYGNDDGWLAGSSASGQLQLYATYYGWEQRWYKGVCGNNTWTRYYYTILNANDIYGGSLTYPATPSRSFGSYTQSDSESATAMTPFIIGNLHLYPNNTMASMTYGGGPMYVYFAALKISKSGILVADYRPVLYNEVPCIQNLVTNRIYQPYGDIPAYSPIFD